MGARWLEEGRRAERSETTTGDMGANIQHPTPNIQHPMAQASGGALEETERTEGQNPNLRFPGSLLFRKARDTTAEGADD
jgi:hypothetical protein